MSENKWIKYEQEKKKLLEKNLSPKEYEQTLRELQGNSEFKEMILWND